MSIFNAPIFSRGANKKNALLKSEEIQKQVYALKDNVQSYLLKNEESFIMKTLTADIAQKNKMPDTLTGLKIPLKHSNMDDFNKGTLNVGYIAENIIMLMGIAPKKYKKGDKYFTFIEKIFSYKGYKNIIKKGRYNAKYGRFADALICYRAGVLFAPDDIDGLYGLARTLREIGKHKEDKADEKNKGEFALYGEINSDDFYVESKNYFEVLTKIYPKYPQAYYFLGYLYKDEGRFNKAIDVWQSFVKVTKVSKDRREIKKRIEQIKDSANIEKGIELVINKKYEEGVKILNEYVDTKFNSYWPLNYYIGIGYKFLGEKTNAIKFLKKAYALNNNIENIKKIIGELNG